MDYKAAYETFLQLVFEEHDYPCAPVVYKLSENPMITREFIDQLLNQVRSRIFKLNLKTETTKEEEYQKDVELFKLNYLTNCLQSPQVTELVNYVGKIHDVPLNVLRGKNLDIFMDVLDNANYHMHTIRIILQELWVTKEVDLVI